MLSVSVTKWYVYGDYCLCLKDQRGYGYWYISTVYDRSSGVLLAIDKEMEDFVLMFEKGANLYDHADKWPDFDWDHFHQKGLKISKRIKKFVGDDVDVIYVKSLEDPNCNIEQRTVVTNDVVNHSYMNT